MDLPLQATALTLAVALALAPRAARAEEQGTPPPEFEPPVLVEAAPAEYPPAAREAGLEAVVVLEILVDATGATTEVKVVGPAGHGFDEAAAAAARRFVWRPGRARGAPVPVRVTYEVRFVLEPAAQADAPPVADAGLSGLLLERGSRRPIEGADVAAIPRGGGDAVAEATTDAEGRFELAPLPPGAYRVVVVAQGYRRGQWEEIVADGELVRVRYFLEPERYDPYQTTIEVAPLREEVERRVIRVEEAVRIPGTRGDALRAVENFPGVARPPLGAGVVVVRGSNPEDTTTYIAGHWVPLLYHFGGLTSVVNSDLLERIDYLPGNFSTRYGRAIGGVIDVELRAPRRDRWGGYVDMDLIDAGFLVEGPVGRGSFAAAARRSYIDTVFGAIVPDDSGLDFTTAPVYWDYQALLDHPLGGGRLQLIAFGSDNRLRFVFGDPSDLDPAFRGAAETHTAFHRVHGNWRRALGPRTDLLVAAGTGYGLAGFGIGPALKFQVDFLYNAWRVELAHRPLRGVRLVVGTDGQAFPFTIDVRGPRPPNEGELPQPPSASMSLHSVRSDHDLHPAIYWEAEIALGGGVKLTPGGRFDWYRIADEVAVDPRLRARWTDDGTNVVRAGLGHYTEQPQGWESDPVFGNPEVDPEKAVHASIGYDRQVTRPIRVETTLFYKWLYDLIVRDDRVVARGDGAGGEALRTLGYSNEGDGRVHGFELLVRHDLGRGFFGWVSYAISRAERRDRPDQAYRPFVFDQTHILTIVASVRLPWRLEAGVRVRYVTGNPQTPVVGSIYDADADVYVPIPGAIHSERMPSYQQLDVRVERRFVFDSWTLTAYLDVQNATNRRNPEGYFYSFDYRDRATITGLPIIPSLGVKGEF